MKGPPQQHPLPKLRISQGEVSGVSNESLLLTALVFSLTASPKP